MSSINPPAKPVKNPFDPLREEEVQNITRLFELAADDFPNAYVLFGARKRGTNGIAVGKAVRLADLPTWLADFRPSLHYDYYMTANLFKGGFKAETLPLWRRDENLLSLCNTVIDVDCHGEMFDELGVMLRKQRCKTLWEQMASWLQNRHRINATATFFTGRGVQIWFSHQPTAMAARWLHDKLTAALNEFLVRPLTSEFTSDPYGILEGFNVDVAASSRISGWFRMPFTHNLKAKAKVTMLYAGSSLRIPVKEVLYMWGYNNLDLPKKQGATPKANMPLETSQNVSKGVETQKAMRGTRAPRFVPLAMFRKAFLEWLVPRIGVGRRELCIFAYASAIKQLPLEGATLRGMVSKYNLSLPTPLPEKEIEDILEATKKPDHYRHIQTGWFDSLGVTKEEIEEFTAQYERPYEVRKRVYKANNPAKKRREAQRKEKYMRIQQLLEYGLSRRAIAAEIHCSLRDVQKAANMDWIDDVTTFENEEEKELVTPEESVTSFEIEDPEKPLNTPLPEPEPAPQPEPRNEVPLFSFSPEPEPVPRKPLFSPEERPSIQQVLRRVQESLGRPVLDDESKTEPEEEEKPKKIEVNGASIAILDMYLDEYRKSGKISPVVARSLLLRGFETIQDYERFRRQYRAQHGY